MAGRRVALKAIDWMAFAERVPPNQKPMFIALKTRSDALSAKWVFSQFKNLSHMPWGDDVGWLKLCCICYIHLWLEMEF